MSVVDIIIKLNKQQQIIAIQWQNSQLEALYATEWNQYNGVTIKQIPDLKLDSVQKTIEWKSEFFRYHQLDSIYLILKKIDNKLPLLEFALGQIKKGVQVYDQNASILYLNKTSRAISNIPNHVAVEGKHLFDLYEVKEEISSVMTTLRTRAPVIGRFDRFQSTEGYSIATINNAYPVLEDDKLLGAVVFEQNIDHLQKQLNELEELKRIVGEKEKLTSVSRYRGYQFDDFVGQNPLLLDAIKLAKRVATKECNIFIVGETGTGKEIFAQSIHKASSRNKNRFVAINCAAVPESLMESLFFGTSRGSFTGSIDKAGLFEEADEGTFFLDELNSMSLSTQSKILRVIQEGVFRRVGGDRDIHVNIRFISSSNEDPKILIENNILRKDLFYRLSTVTIEIPPLRQRKGDIKELTTFYLRKNIDRYVKSIHEVAPEVYALFENYSWPGNIRELFNVLDYVLNTMDGDCIKITHLPKQFQHTVGSLMSENIQEQENPSQSDNQCIITQSSDNQTIDVVLAKVEKQLIESLLLQYRYNVTKAARAAGMSRQSLQYRIKKLDINS